jgi:uncharacterized protein (DUF1778 family)
MTDTKQTTINIRSHSATIALIDKAADIEGKTRSAFLRDCAIVAAMEVFEKPRLLGEACPVCGHIKSR